MITKSNPNRRLLGCIRATVQLENRMIDHQLLIFESLSFTQRLLIEIVRLDRRKTKAL